MNSKGVTLKLSMPKRNGGERAGKLVGERGFEPPTSASRTLRAKPDCATPRIYAILKPSASRTLRAKPDCATPRQRLL